MPLTYEDLVSGKVPLRFGDQEQIAVIDSRIIALAKEKELLDAKKVKWDPKVKKRFAVILYFTGETEVLVNAGDPDEASALACDLYERSEVDLDIESHSVKVIGFAEE